MSAVGARFEAMWERYILAELCEKCGARPEVDCDAPELAGLEPRRRRQHNVRAAAGSRVLRKAML